LLWTCFAGSLLVEEIMAKKKQVQWQSKIVGHDRVPAGQLLANPYNHRRHPQQQRDVVAASIDEIGFIKSVIVNRTTGHIVDGHERVMQALGVGEGTLVDVEYVELSPEDEKKALLILDASSELAEVDAADVNALVQECAWDNEVLSNFCNEAFSDLLDEPVITPDAEDAPTVEESPTRCKAGDLWILGDSAAFDAMKPGAAFYIWHADSEGYNFRGAVVDCKQKVRQCLIWKKQTMVMGRQDYQWKHEPCLYGWKSGASHQWLSDRKQTTILEFDRPTRSEEHPTMKPVSLIGYQIGNSLGPQGLVFDSFLGSGTTLIAAEQLGRKCYGMEISPRYCDVIIHRWEMLTKKQAVLAET